MQQYSLRKRRRRTRVHALGVLPTALIRPPALDRGGFVLELLTEIAVGATLLLLRSQSAQSPRDLGRAEIVVRLRHVVVVAVAGGGGCPES